MVYRSRGCIIADILKVVSRTGDGTRFSQIMDGADLSFFQTKRYLDSMVDKRLLKESDRTNARKSYEIGELGARYLNEYPFVIRISEEVGESMRIAKKPSQQKFK